MPRAFGNAIAEIVSAPGTAAFQLGTAAAGCRLFSAATAADGTAIGNGDSVKCAAFAIDANGNPSGGREIGLYTFTTGSPNTLVRTTIIESSNAGAAVNFTGNVRVELIAFVAADVAAPELPAFAGTALPATPVEGHRIFSRSRAGRAVLASRDASGAVREAMAQQGVVAQRIAMATSGVAAPSSLGFSLTAIGTNTARTPAGTNFFTESVRAGSVSAATAGSSAGWRHNLTALRGGAAGRGGVYLICTFGTNAFASDGRLFVGLTSLATAIGNVDPSTLTNLVGLAADSGDSNLQIITNDGSGLATKTDLGASFPAKTAATDIYELRLFALPNSGSLGWSVERRNTGDFTSGTISADLPVNTTLLAPQIWINNGATAAAVGIDLCTLFVETPV